MNAPNLAGAILPDVNAAGLIGADQFRLAIPVEVDDTHPDDRPMRAEEEAGRGRGGEPDPDGCGRAVMRDDVADAIAVKIAENLIGLGGPRQRGNPDRKDQEDPSEPSVNPHELQGVALGAGRRRPRPHILNDDVDQAVASARALQHVARAFGLFTSEPEHRRSHACTVSHQHPATDLLRSGKLTRSSSFPYDSRVWDSLASTCGAIMRDRNRPENPQRSHRRERALAPHDRHAAITRGRPTPR